MNIGQICTRQVITADQGSTVRQAARLMREYHLGTHVATQSSPDGVQAIGIVTDRDLVVEAMARGLDAEQTELRRLFDSKLATVPASASIDEATTVMKRQGVRRLLVSGEGDRLYGIVSVDDVLDALSQEMSEVAHVVRAGIEREIAERPSLPAMEVESVRVPPFPGY
jgi:CBS domain-containing protein